MTKNFYVILPSNSPVEGNRTNSFHVRLPKKLQFNSDWSVGLAVLYYPHTWPILGTTKQQHMDIHWKTGESLRIVVSTSNFANPDDLLKILQETLYEGSKDLVKNLRSLQFDLIGISERAKQNATEVIEKREKESKIEKVVVGSDGQTETSGSSENAPLQGVFGSKEETDQIEKENFTKEFEKFYKEEVSKLDAESQKNIQGTAEMGLPAWIEAYRRVRFTCKFEFLENMQRFKISMDKNFVNKIEITDQLAYILGLESPVLMQSETLAKFPPDMKGGVSTFFIYTPGLIEPVVIGDVTAPILRMVAIKGNRDDVIEEIYTPIQYHKILTKEISEIFVEIRTISGELMPFAYGTSTLVLHFCKMSYF